MKCIALCKTGGAFRGLVFFSLRFAVNSQLPKELNELLLVPGQIGYY
jgi:hypothetical protein